MEVGEEIIRWSHNYSAWELFALETCQIFHTPGVGTGKDDWDDSVLSHCSLGMDGGSERRLCVNFSDPSPSRQVERVTEIAKLVTEMLKHDWSLAGYLHPITLQYFNIIQT